MSLLHACPKNSQMQRRKTYEDKASLFFLSNSFYLKRGFSSKVFNEVAVGNFGEVRMSLFALICKKWLIMME